MQLLLRENEKGSSSSISGAATKQYHQPAFTGALYSVLIAKKIPVLLVT
jgi:hypothetical protein